MQPSDHSPPPFLLQTTPLPVGKTLIEASAGTGKTFSLTGIILRLLLEEGLGIDEILTVTYTEAATAELRDRVRLRLRSMLDHFQQRHTAKPDSLEASFLERLAGEPRAEAILRLQEAIDTLDKASIFTIHGFCARTLGEFAFESGSLFQADVLTDEKQEIEDLTKDLWRRLILSSDEEEHCILLGILGIPDIGKLSKHLRDFSPHPEAPPSSTVPDPLDLFEHIFREVRSHLPALKAALLSEKETLLRLFRENGQLHGQRYQEKRRASAIAFVEAVCAGESVLTSLYTYQSANGSLEFFTQEKILNVGTKSTTLPLEHQAFALTSQLASLIESANSRIKEALLNWMASALEETKARQNVMTFDDMILRMRLAVTRSPELVGLLRDKFRACLIDEFQDTDAVQLDIFEALFDTPEHRLICVGDPKQSIYKFRGAEIGTYLRVSRDPGVRKLTLLTNYRSTGPVVSAINHLFLSREQDAFGDGIAFHEVSVSENTDPIQAMAAGPAFTFRELPQAVELLAGMETIGVIKSLRLKYPSYKSIAVLVNANFQASMIARLAREEGIPCIRRLDQSAYATTEARLLFNALSGILECHRLGLMKAALLTPLFGRDPAYVASLDTNDSRLDAEMEDLYGLRQLWLRQGFMAAFEQLLFQRSVRKRLVSSPGGEESLTLFLQLAELLNEEACTGHHTPEALLQFLARQLAHPSGQGDKAKVRRSTDADAVTISTIHSSKGLEYDVVILPLLWLGSKSVEDSAEEMRKTYVALTRARYACVLFVADHTYTHQTALHQLLAEEEETLVDAARRAAATSSGTIAFADSPLEAPPRPVSEESAAPVLRPWPQIPRDRILTSFSGLAHASKEPVPPGSFLEESPLFKADELKPADSPGDLEESTVLRPGAAAGTAVHAILEKLDFASVEGLSSLVRQELDRQGLLSEAAADYLIRQVPAWLTTPLEVNGFTLSDIRQTRRLNELEFHFPLRGFSRGALAEAVQPEDWPELSTKLLHQQSMEGFMKGYIDLVFEQGGKWYILDWKTNYLGPNRQSYSPSAIRGSMLESLYALQYLIYTIALDAHLQARLPDYHYVTHFGGVYYVYLRGFGGAPGHAVFKALPRAATVDKLRSLLLDHPA